MKKLVFFMLIILAFGGCTKEFGRKVKDTQSRFVGLDRKITVYSPDGSVIKTYEGRIDIQDTDYGNKIKFEVDGKRVILYNAIVVVEEK